MTAAAIRATFSDWRTVKGRKVLQLVFEVPLEQQTEVLTMLGAPMPDDPKWCGIALLANGPEPQRTDTLRSERAKETYRQSSAAEQAVVRAAMLPKDERFRAWVSRERWSGADDDMASEHTAVKHIRDHCCSGKSRSLIAEVPEYLDRFLAMETEYLVAIGQIAEPR